MHGTHLNKLRVISNQFELNFWKEQQSVYAYCEAYSQVTVVSQLSVEDFEMGTQFFLRTGSDLLKS